LTQGAELFIEGDLNELVVNQNSINEKTTRTLIPSQWIWFINGCLYLEVYLVWKNVLFYSTNEIDHSYFENKKLTDLASNQFNLLKISIYIITT